MIRYALVDGQKTEPIKGLKGTCPACENPMSAKCGTIKVHHWAHHKSMSCDSWWEPMTQWHLDWQDKFPIAWREITLRNELSKEFHRADIYTSNGVTIEFQHSPLSSEEIEKRNLFYDKLIWVINGERFKKNLIITSDIPHPNSPLLKDYIFSVYESAFYQSPTFFLTEEYQEYGSSSKRYYLDDPELESVVEEHEESEKVYFLFRWAYKHKTWLKSTVPVFIDFGEDVLYRIRKRRQINMTMVYLQVVKKQDFLLKYAYP